jgi:hypothetical protein
MHSSIDSVRASLMREEVNYGIEEHRHRFSVWAAARAAQRGFTTVDKLRKALENSGVVEFLSTGDWESVDQEQFDALHRTWCRAVMSWLSDAGVEKVTFGRAAKLIGMYLKSMVVLGPGYGSALSRVAHPPIDGILLRNVAASPEVVSPHQREWARVRWTKLDEEGYFRLVGQLLEALPPEEPFWVLERYWTVVDEPEL